MSEAHVRACAVGAFVLGCALAAPARAQTLSNDTFKVTIGSNGEISSLQLTGDAFPTNYVMNAANAPGQNTADHEWVGELMFTYRVAGGAWATALTNQSGDARRIAAGQDAVTVTYQGSANAKGIRDFKVVETYALSGDHLSWQIAVTNTGTEALEIGDFGLPLPFNEYWFGNDLIYETRTVYHSFTGQSSSYITVQRPSGVGPFVLMTPDPATGAGFQYMDGWVAKEHPGSAWAAGGGSPAWPSGLDVFYIHASVIKSTNRGYLPTTSLTLAAGATQTYAFRFFSVASHDAVKDRLYAEGLVDVSVVPGLMLATNMTAAVDLHTSKPINSLVPAYASETTVTPAGTAATDHHLYRLKFAHLGPNAVTVNYGGGETTTLQFYVLEPIDAALQRHATFMVANTQWPGGDLAGVFDDWMMDTHARRGATGGGGWGDDWGWTHAEFLAEKNAQTPVASEVAALDSYLDAVWARAIDNSTYVVQDWWCPPGTSASKVNDCYYDRAYAYPHAFNTYFSMFKVASLYPDLVSYHAPADTYLMRAYNILHTLYSGHGDPGTGYMGEQTLPEIAAALTGAGHTTEASFVKSAINKLWKAFSGSKYPYGSEYSYDNTGEEAVYMAARQNGDAAVLAKVDAKTRACRGQEPVWYYYADPVTLNGENWWQFQYTAALAGAGMDDFVRTQSQRPELDERLAYAAKIANVGAINSGQMDSNPANLGTVAWTYQAMKGNVYVNSFDPTGSTLHAGWRQMAGEADLGLFGAIRILSADVTFDPVFGLTGYGCDVAPSGACLAVTPTDGVFKRLNLISQKLSMQLDRDRYTAAVIGARNDSVAFTLQNQRPGSPHTTHVTLTGLAQGSYPVTVGGTSAGTVTATAGAATVLALAVGAAASYAVQVGMPCGTGGGAPAAGGMSGAGGTSGVGGMSGSPGGRAAGGAGGSGGAPGGAAGGLDPAGAGGGPAAGGPAARTGGGAGCSCSQAGSGDGGGRAAALLGLLGCLVVAFRAPGRTRRQESGARTRNF
jgi:hypothetical protein